MRAAHRGRRRRRAGLAGLVVGLVALLAYTAFFRPGRLRVSSHPPGAEIRAGATLVGVTPLASPWVAWPHSGFGTFVGPTVDVPEGRDGRPVVPEALLS